MRSNFCNVGLVALLLTAFSRASSLVLHEKRDIALLKGALLQRQKIERHALLPMRIGLRQNQHAELNAEKWIMDVSDPDSPNYGRHWTQDEVIEAFKPSDETLRNVTAWLHSHGISEFTHSDNKMWFAFDASVGKAESMLNTEYFEHVTENGVFEAWCDHYHLPSHLQPHIHYITPGVKSSDITGRTARSRLFKRSSTNELTHSTKRDIEKRKDPPYNSSTSLEHCAREVTPACIRTLYNFSMPDPDIPVHPNNSLGIFEAQNNLYLQGDLNLFYQYFAPNIPDGTNPIFAPIDGSLYPPNVTHGKGIYFGLSTETNLDLECAIPIIYPQNVTLYALESPRPNGGPLKWVNFFNRFLDAIDGSYCSDEQRGNSTAGGKPRCGILKPTNVISFSWGAPEHVFPPYWQERQCNEYLKLGLQGVSLFFSSGDNGVGALGMLSKHRRGLQCQSNHTRARVFMPDFPADCPWVTAVGATEIHSGNTVYDPEIAANWDQYEDGKHRWGGGSGGGFALQFSAPEYQKDAISKFFDNHNPPWPYFYNGKWKSDNGSGSYTGSYNRNGRGYPDISAIGTHIATFLGISYYRDAGTSASAPIVAALFNRIVEERLRVGKGPLGFVNPTLYKNPGALNDVVKGANGFCYKTAGFEAVPGWDPVTGLGTPNYPKLLDVFMKLP